MRRLILFQKNLLFSKLFVKFIPESDEQIQRLLAVRLDTFSDYDQTNFESAFGMLFDVVDKKNIDESKRTLYLMKKKDSHL